MKHLIIYAHPSTKSFSKQLKDALVAESNLRNWSSIVRDLYEMKFDPVLWPSDLENLNKGEPSEKIVYEQNLVQEADIISVVYPLWWAGFPAILKGYIDKVFSYGFAYKSSSKGIEGQLTNKRIYLYTSMGNTVEQYEEKGLIDALKKIHGSEIFEFCGMHVINHLFFPQIPSASSEDIQDHINDALAVFEPLSRPLSEN